MMPVGVDVLDDGSAVVVCSVEGAHHHSNRAAHSPLVCVALQDDEGRRTQGEGRRSEVLAWLVVGVVKFRN